MSIICSFFLFLTVDYLKRVAKINELKYLLPKRFNAVKIKKA
jgi:hypothetical protein